jgi:hypothetical protein
MEMEVTMAAIIVVRMILVTRTVVAEMILAIVTVMVESNRIKR